MYRFLFAAVAVLSTTAAYGAALTCTPIGVGTLEAPQVSVRIGDFDCSNVLTFSGEKPVLVSLPGPIGENAITVPDVFSLRSFSAVINSDPFINYAFAIANLTAAPQDVTVVFSSPFTGGPYGSLASSHQLGVTDGDGNGSVSVQPIAGQSFIHQPFVDGADVDGLNPGCTLSPGAGGSASCYASGAPTFVGISTGATGTFGVRIQFTLSPGDLISTSGRVELFPSGVPLGNTPEPATLGTLGAGLAALVVWRRRTTKS